MSRDLVARRSFLATSAIGLAGSVVLQCHGARGAFSVDAVSDGIDSDDIVSTGKESPEGAPIDRMMRKFLADHRIPGASISVGKDGKILYSRGFGYADRETKEKVEPDSLFRIASISKCITAVGVLQQIERGKLDFSSKVAEVLEWNTFADPRWKEITIRQLLQHTAGFDRDKSYDPMFITRRIAQEEKLRQPIGYDAILTYMRKQPLDFDPGARFAYSNIGYCILGRVLEKCTGLGYEESIRESILRPLGIGAQGKRSMCIGKSPFKDRCQGEVRYYDQKNRKSDAVVGEVGAIVESPYGEWDLESLDAHGGWIASSSDLVQFSMGVEQGKTRQLLKRKTLVEMRNPPVSNPHADVYYGCGWNVRKVKDDTYNLWHIGELPGTSGILVQRHDGFHWAVLLNTQYTSEGKNAAGEIDSLVHVAVNEVKGWFKGKKQGSR